MARNESVRMHPLSRIPGFVIILAIGLAIIGYGITLELYPNGVIGIVIGIVFLLIAILSITVVR